MADAYRVGGEVDAVCTRCKMTLAHTILAMVGTKPARVRCNTCQGEHNYHAGGGKTRRSRDKKSATPRPAARAAAAVSGQDLDALLKGKDISQPLRYEASAIFTEGAVVEHPTFGLGVIVAVRGEKMDVVFRAGLKTMAQRRGGAVPPRRLSEASRPLEAEPDEGSAP